MYLCTQESASCECLDLASANGRFLATSPNSDFSEGAGWGESLGGPSPAAVLTRLRPHPCQIGAGSWAPLGVRSAELSGRRVTQQNQRLPGPDKSVPEKVCLSGWSGKALGFGVCVGECVQVKLCVILTMNLFVLVCASVLRRAS